MKRRTTLTATACLAGAAVLVTGGILVTSQPGAPVSADTVAETVATGTAPVERGDLSGTTTKSGTLSGEPGPTVRAGVGGTLTAIPALGTVLKPRDDLYRVDDHQVTLFRGVLPQWRAFEDGMSDGTDVKQLEDNLHAWGYLRQAATRHFDWHTRVAIRAWQKATGQPQSGRIELGRIWFAPADLVVSERKAAVGDPATAGAELFGTSGTQKVVTVDLPVGSPLAKVGGVVGIALPGGARVPGKVTSIGDPTTDEDGRTTTPVTITPDDAAKVGSLNQVEVSVDFVSDTRTNVLSVPVTALGAKSGGGFVIEVVGSGGTHKRVPVEVGLFAGDRVEITSGALKAGDRVVVPV